MVSFGPLRGVAGRRGGEGGIDIAIFEKQFWRADGQCAL